REAGSDWETENPVQRPDQTPGGREDLSSPLQMRRSRQRCPLPVQGARDDWSLRPEAATKSIAEWTWNAQPPAVLEQRLGLVGARQSLRPRWEVDQECRRPAPRQPITSQIVPELTEGGSASLRWLCFVMSFPFPCGSWRSRSSGEGTPTALLFSFLR